MTLAQVPPRASGAERVVDLLLRDPAGLGGMVLTGDPEPYVTALAARLGSHLLRLPPNLDPARLDDAPDLAATLAAGRPVTTPGLLSRAQVLVVPQAQRLDPALAARLATALDAGEVALVLLDDGAPDDPPPPPALTDRLALIPATPAHEHRAGDPEFPSTPVEGRETARLRRPEGGGPADTPLSAPDAIAALVETAARLRVAAARAALLAWRTARASAAGRPLTEADLIRAVELVLAPRAASPPPGEEHAAPEAPSAGEPPPPDADGSTSEAERDSAPTDLADILVAAATAAVPPRLLAQLAARRDRSRAPVAGSGTGARRVGTGRGRPAGHRPGDPRRGGRLDLVATLAAAAPWRRLRAPHPTGAIPLRPSDLRVRRTIARAEATTLFVVDASGSAALARLAETKGAVESLLAQSYVTRTRVALIAFRGQAADLLLPPTRSLTRARRALAGLAGGGGTPLAAALDMAHALVRRERAAGRTPFAVLLTDGRANVAREGVAGRARAEADATDAATRLAGTPSLVIDTSPRPGPAAAALARAMQARYVPLPHVDAGRLAALVTAAQA